MCTKALPEDNWTPEKIYFLSFPKSAKKLTTQWEISGPWPEKEEEKKSREGGR